MLPSSNQEKGVRPLFSGGERFGPYRIARLLGRGGMGDVYEAKQIEQGRRVAIKVLSQRLNDPQDRARFLREGQLAASISHPHSVYIFGSEEIAGVPVIAMELLPGGTLKDRIARGGPMRPADAVDAILQVIAGLDAAQAAGILHRDIKPSNCFIDSAGDVKVGDFGLSISTLARDMSQLTIRGTFHGTPQFAAPEQLRGEPLDVRADIYAVGATLFYLLTGRSPFDDRDLMTLLARIATEPPPSPRALAPLVPRALAAVVMRCLAKDRAQRPASYAALDDELRPFGSAAPTPATLGLRFLAGIVDATLLSIPIFPLTMTFMSGLTSRASMLRLGSINIFMALAYYGLLEGIWGATIGKWICRLRVVGPDGQRPGLKRALLRAAIFEVPAIVATLPGVIIGPARMFQLALRPPIAWALNAPYYLSFAALFSTPRRRNGFAALHELASGTRVVQRIKRGELRTPIGEPALAVVDVSRARGKCGPFDVVGVLGPTDRGELLLGFDASLRRNVWIHVLPSGAPAVDPQRRDLTRPGRLRWLNGQRTADEAWDAYEALDGSAFNALMKDGAPHPWRRVRYWLLDLARELDASLGDGSLSLLTRDRVWITRDGRAKLFDFTPPGALQGTDPERPVTLGDVQVFLGDLARRGLRGLAPLPLSASQLLVKLDHRGFADAPRMVSELAALAKRPADVEWWRRGVVVGLSAAPALSMGIMIGVVAPLVVHRMMPSGAIELMTCLVELKSIPVAATGAEGHKRAMLETYVAGRYRPLITGRSPDDAFMIGVLSQNADEIDRILRTYPNVSPEETAQAGAEIEPFLKGVRDASRFESGGPDMFGVALFLFVVTSIFGVLSSWIFRGGWLMRALGIAVVVDSGQEASRVRTLWRGVVAWSAVPVLFYIVEAKTMMFVDFWSEARTHPFAAASVYILIVLFVVGTVYAVLNPERGWQDRLAGTWLVPR
jgi:hypothetical protein